jgi:acyl carrier protein
MIFAVGSRKTATVLHPSKNRYSGQELARNALENFNRAEGQLLDPQNQLIALVGKACAYKLLEMRGAYNSAAQNANQLYSSLKANNDRVIRLRQIFSEQLGVDLSEVKPEVSFQRDLGADSLDAIELIMTIEEEFDIEIPDQDAERILTFRDAIGYLKSKL